MRRRRRRREWRSGRSTARGMCTAGSLFGSPLSSVNLPAQPVRSRGCKDRPLLRPGWRRRHVPARRPGSRRASRAPPATASSVLCPISARTTDASMRSFARRRRSCGVRMTCAMMPCVRRTSWTTSERPPSGGSTCGWMRPAFQRTSSCWTSASGTSSRHSSCAHPTSANHRYASLHVTTSCVTP